MTVDGGPGNDTITTGNARVLGGPGDDAITLPSNPGDHTGPVIDCGPGNDHFENGSTLPASVRPTIDAATCPPILRALGRFRRATNESYAPPTFKVSANRRLRLALFRAAQARERHGALSRIRRQVVVWQVGRVPRRGRRASARDAEHHAQRPSGAARCWTCAA